MTKKVSILIPVKADNPNLRQCLDHCRALDYADFEIILLPDKGIENAGECLRVIPTGPANPGHKRDIGLREAAGEIIAFIDDDAYPERDWLKNAVRHFDEVSVAAVGGPGLTPKEDSLPQKASGCVYSSPLVSGTHTLRYIPGKKTEVDDFPSCNFIILRSALLEAGGFKINFWPGEDTVLCAKITKLLKKRIIYDPEVIVYHHRRPLFAGHLAQIRSYGLHRGHFVKKYPATSFRLSYFLPSLLTIGLVAGPAAGLIHPAIRSLYAYSVFLYLFLVLLSSLKGKKISLFIYVFLGIILTHITYGTAFIQGLFAKRLKDE